MHFFLICCHFVIRLMLWQLATPSNFPNIFDRNPASDESIMSLFENEDLAPNIRG